MPKKNNMKNKILLNQCKSNAFTLYKKGQIPYQLYISIISLKIDDEKLIKKINYLSELSAFYIRVPKFYFHHLDVASLYNDEIKSQLQSFEDVIN